MLAGLPNAPSAYSLNTNPDLAFSRMNIVLSRMVECGVITQEQADDILVNGKNPADMPIQYADDVTLKYNADIASELGIEIPDDMVAIEKEDK